MKVPCQNMRQKFHGKKAYIYMWPTLYRVHLQTWKEVGLQFWLGKAAAFSSSCCRHCQCQARVITTWLRDWRSLAFTLSRSSSRFFFFGAGWSLSLAGAYECCLCVCLFVCATITKRTTFVYRFCSIYSTTKIYLPLKWVTMTTTPTPAPAPASILWPFISCVLL